MILSQLQYIWAQLRNILVRSHSFYIVQLHLRYKPKLDVMHALVPVDEHRPQAVPYLNYAGSFACNDNKAIYISMSISLKSRLPVHHF